MNETTQAVALRPAGEAYLPDMPMISAEVIEKALTIGDMSKMPPEVRVRYYLAVCQSAGLNPLTRPFTPMKDQSGQVILYANKDCAEQLRAKHRVSVRTLSREKEDGLYIVTVEGRMPNGRSEEAQGIVDIGGLKGQPLANAMMKANTKAVRRVTLALCGLGFPLADEGDGHPVAMNWQTGEMREAQPPIPLMETASLEQHISDLFPPSSVSGHGTVELCTEIEAILVAQGVSDAEREAFWQKQEGKMSPGHLTYLKDRLQVKAASKGKKTAQDAPQSTQPSEDDLPDTPVPEGVNTATGEVVDAVAHADAERGRSETEEEPF